MGRLMFNRNQGQNNNRKKIGCLNGSYMDRNGNLVLSNPFEPRPNYTMDTSGNI